MTYPQGANTYTLGFGSRGENVEVPTYSTRAPSTADVNYPIGKRWINQASNTEYSLTSFTTTQGVVSATWTLLGAGSGDLNTLTTQDSTIVMPTAGNINISGSNTIKTTGSNSPGVVTIVPTASGYPITPFVVGPSGEAGYQTIQSAINAATSAGGSNVIWVQPGTYTENLNITSSITFLSIDGVATIIGQHTPPSTGAVTFDGFVLESNTDILNSSAAGSTVFNINNSFIIIQSGYIFNLPNWTGEILMDNCGEASVNDGVVNNITGSSSIKMINVEMGAGSSKTMQLNCGGGFLRFDTCNVNCPVNMQGSGNLYFQNGVKFLNTVTIGGSLTGYCIDTSFLTGANQAITFNSSGNFSISNAEVRSSFNPAIGGTGSGTLQLGAISFSSNSSLAGTLTLQWMATKTGSFTVSSGSATISNGNVVLSTAGNKINSTSVASTTTAGANSFGTVALSGGTATVNTTAVTASSLIFATVQALGTVATAKPIAITAKSAGTSFTITSSDNTDTSTVAWFIVN